MKTNSYLTTTSLLKGLFTGIFTITAISGVNAQGNTNCIDPNQIDSNVVCPMLYAPVCGCDGITYDNHCFATNYGGVTSYTQGPCNTTGTCQANFSWSENNMYAGIGTMIDFTDISSGNPTMWAWDFGDGYSATGQNPSHVYYQTGAYQVCLSIGDTGTSCYDQYCATVYVGQNNMQCYAYFTYTTTDSTGITFQFNDLSSGSIMQWHWDFGDGSNAFGQNQTHTFSQSGMYTVCLTIYDSMQTCSNTYCEEIWIGGNGTTSCYASFYWYEGQGNPNCIIFSDASWGNANSWYWDFGDGNSSTSQSPVHHFDSAGIYTVCLTITDSSANCTGSYCEDVWVGGNVTTGCYAYFYYYSNYPDTSHGIYFVDASYSDDSVMGWQWDFGDGTVSSDQNPYHEFPMAGYYYVCLTLVTDSNSLCTSSYCEYIYIGPVNNCGAYFEHHPDTAGLGVTFIDQSTGTPTNWYWDFGDGNGSTNQDPHHVYADSGIYTVCLTIYDSLSMNNNGSNIGGCYSSYCAIVFAGCTDSILMLPFPQILVDSSGTGNVIGVGFNNGQQMNVTWVFADSSISNTNPQFMFDSTGNYPICVTYQMGNGCMYTWCDTVYVMKTNTGISKSEIRNHKSEITVYPNPVSGNATIEFNLNKAAKVDVGVFNMAGERITSIVNENLKPEKHSYRWNAEGTGSGIYFIRMNSDEGSRQLRVAVVK